MEKRLIHRISNREGHIDIYLKKLQDGGETAFLKSNKSIQIEEFLERKYPIEAIQISQKLSSKSGVAHGLAATMALEDYLKIEPTKSAQQVRQFMLLISTIRSHIHHFYWEVLPDYINYGYLLDETKPYYTNVAIKPFNSNDIDIQIAQEILLHLPIAQQALNLLQKILTNFGGKFPVVMNFVPGGITNFTIARTEIMTNLRYLEQIKEFVESIWSNDLKILLSNVRSSTQVTGDDLNLISFGSLEVEQDKQKNQFYSAGVLLDEKLEPLNDLKITESLNHTYYRLNPQFNDEQDIYFDPEKQDAYTWIKGARYDSKTMYAGALSRMLITHFGGGNIEVSSAMHEMINSLKLPQESPNCLASRLLAESIESGFYFKNALKILLEIDPKGDSNLKQTFDFTNTGSGKGKIEAPGGSLLHNVFIKNNRIEKYRIITATNWNFSTYDELNKTGIVEMELNRILQYNELTADLCSKLLNSYYIQVQDGTQ